MREYHPDLTPGVIGATGRLLEIAESDTVQSARCVSFILAWWNAEEHGGFDLTDLANVDMAIAKDMLTVMTFLATSTLEYPTEFRSRIEGLIARRGAI